MEQRLKQQQILCVISKSIICIKPVSHGLVSLFVGIVRLLLNSIIRVIELSLIFLIIVRNDLFRRFSLAALVYLEAVKKPNTGSIGVRDSY